MHNSTNFNSLSEALANATGPIDYNMTNDYMFRAILQKNNNVLKGLICSLLHLKPSEIKSIEIKNPIELGKAMDEKEFILDLKILLNNDTIINLEMQVQAQLYWNDRSLVYLCRSFDQLYSGEQYSAAKPAIHIGFLDFTPFRNNPEFYATYKLMNVKNHNVYSDKFILRVVDLTKIELATGEDKQYQIDYWASLFKAKTWEELKMIAENNEFMQEATETLYALNADELIRQQCLAREDYYRTQNTYDKVINDQAQMILNQELEIESLNGEKAALTAENDSLTAEINGLTAENDSLTAEIDGLTAENLKLLARIKQLETQFGSL